jgi:transcriptional regulator with XRE-family HTH domain
MNSYQATGERSEYAVALGDRLRAARTRLGLSLGAVEGKSGRRLKAAVVGTYERGERSVTVEKLAEIAGFYGVSVVALLPGGAAEESAETERGRLALAAVEKLAGAIGVSVDQLLAAGEN